MNCPKCGQKAYQVNESSTFFQCGCGWGGYADDQPDGPLSDSTLNDWLSYCSTNPWDAHAHINVCDLRRLITEVQESRAEKVRATEPKPEPPPEPEPKREARSKTPRNRK